MAKDDNEKDPSTIVQDLFSNLGNLIGEIGSGPSNVNQRVVVNKGTVIGKVGKPASSGSSENEKSTESSSEDMDDNVMSNRDLDVPDMAKLMMAVKAVVDGEGYVFSPLVLGISPATVSKINSGDIDALAKMEWKTFVKIVENLMLSPEGNNKQFPDEFLKKLNHKKPVNYKQWKAVFLHYANLEESWIEGV